MNLLIADDELIIREGLKSLNWASIGVTRVFAVQNGLEAKECLEKYDIDIAILDIQMPGQTGLELAKFIHQEELNTAVVFLTGYAEFDYARKAIKYGVSEYIVKPFRPREITGVVHEIIKKRNTESSAQRKDQNETVSIAQQVRKYYSATDESCQKIIEEILENYRMEITLDEIAEKYHFSPSYLSRKIKQEAKNSFMEILKAVRLTYAVENILNGMKISDAGYEAGFQDQRYFSQVFKGVFEFSPSELKSNMNGPVPFSDVMVYINDKNKQKKRDE